MSHFDLLTESASDAAPRTIIVGAGQAGAWVAITLRAQDPSRHIIMIGDEPYAPYERPFLSKGLLSGKTASSFIRPPDFYEQERIDWRPSCRVETINRSAHRIHVSERSGRTYDLSYETLVLATGARPRLLSVAGTKSPNVLYLRNFDDAMALKSRLRRGCRIAVVGAGFLGLEVAAAARAEECSVSVIEQAPGVLARVVDAETAGAIAARHIAEGVHLLCGREVINIGTDVEGTMLTLDYGERLRVDLVVVAIGAHPNDELAARAGLVVKEGIVVDEYGRTNDPAIFAVGDVARHHNPLLARSLRLESWQNAQNQGIAIARYLAGGEKPHAEIPWFWTDQYDWNLQIAGAPEHWEQVVRRNLAGISKSSTFYLLDGRVVGANTLNNGRDMRILREMIRCGSRIDPASLADPAIPLSHLNEKQKAD